MSSNPPITRPEPEFEGDYRPADAENPHAHIDPLNVRIEATDLTFLATWRIHSTPLSICRRS